MPYIPKRDGVLILNCFVDVSKISIFTDVKEMNLTSVLQKNEIAIILAFLLFKFINFHLK